MRGLGSALVWVFGGWACRVQPPSVDSETGVPAAAAEPASCGALQVEPGQFEGLTSDEMGGFERSDQRGPGLAVGDLDGDGFLDVVMALPNRSSRIYINDGEGGLVETTVQLSDGAPLPPAIGTGAVDVDADGDLDLLFTTQLGWPTMLLQNQGDLSFTMTTISDESGETKTGSFGDADGDGDLDLFIAGFVADANGVLISKGEQVGDGNHLYLQDADGGFARAADALPDEVFEALTYQGIWMDADLDGDLDIYMSNDHGVQLIPNKLLLNDGAGHFTVDEDCFCDLAVAGMGGAVADVDGNGYPDIYTTDDGNIFLLLNMGADGFYDATLAHGAAPVRDEMGASWGTQFVDLDQDGFEDIVTAYGPLRLTDEDPEQHDVILRANGDGTFTDVSTQAGFSEHGVGRSVAVGDLDRDGRPDFVVGGVRDQDPGYYFRTWFSRDGCSPGVTVAFEGTHGFGARLEVLMPDGRTVSRWVESSTTYGSSAPELYLGLSGAESLPSVTAHWLDGSQSQRLDVPAGTRIVMQPD